MSSPHPPPSPHRPPSPYAAATPVVAPSTGDGAPARTEPAGNLPYPLLLLRGRPGWAWPFLGLVVLVAGFVVFQIAETVGFAVYYVARGLGNEAAQHRLTGKVVTPGYLAFLNLSLAALVPLAGLTAYLVHGLRPGWVVSVVGRIRWRWLAVSFGLALVALAATLVVGALVPSQGDGSELGGTLNHFSATSRDFALVVLLLTPLQAAGEEFGFRGYLTLAVGRLFAFKPWLATVLAVLIPSILFALAHGAQDGPVFVDRLSFGIVAGILVITTGGLEAGIAMHVLNNFLAFGLAIAFGDMTTALKPGDGSWWSLPVTMTQSLVYLGLATYAARRMGLATRSAPAHAPGDSALEGPRARV